MAGRNMDLQVIVRLRDLLTSPLRGLRSGLEGIANMARRIGVVGTAIAAISFMGPMQEAAAFQQQLIDIAGTQQLAGDAAFKFVDEAKGKYEELALQVGQYSNTIAQGAGKMVAAGLDDSVVNGSMESIARATKAANASFDDMSGVAISLLQTLKLPADQLEDTFAGLIVAGKMGSFELKDMARYFPTLTSQFAKLGIAGRDAATQLASMLEIARKGTADPAEAANNLNNFLSKVTAPETLKNFQKMGVDIMAVMQDATTKGISPIEAVVQKIQTLTGVSGKEIEGLMKRAKDNGLTGADALEEVRKQLEAIHGAGALGGLFSDMQVMGFLIPMLGNIDEYKRIKEEVAKATGAMIDDDFDTQMRGLNTQLIIFNEIGTQAMREVGLAFGTWMPTINTYLQDGLKWLRELDKSTGGWVRQGLMFAGAAVLVAGALGALGVVLPVIGAGFAALATLLGPVGLVIGAIGLGAKHIYDNWGSYGPRVMRMWDRMKSGFRDMMTRGRELVREYGPRVAHAFNDVWLRARDGALSFVQTIRDATPQIIAAGREMVDRYGPVVKDGFNTAWKDIEAGWKNVQGLFTGFAKGLDLKLDLSGLTIDDAKVAAFKTLDTALNGIARAWDTLKAFGSGFAAYLEPIGKNIGGTVKAVGELASGLWRLASAIGKLIPSMSEESSGAIAKWFGGFGGGAIDTATFTIQTLAQAFADLVNWIADLAEGKVKIDWAGMIPDGWAKKFDEIVTKAREMPGKMYQAGIDMAQSFKDGVTAKIDELVVWFQGLPDRIMAAIGKLDILSAMGVPESVQKFLGLGPVEKPQPPVTVPANQNLKVNATGDAGRGLARAEAQAGQTVAVESEVKVGGSITVKIDGPGRVTGTTTENSAVPIVGNTGRAVGRI